MSYDLPKCTKSLKLSVWWAQVPWCARNSYLLHALPSPCSSRVNRHRPLFVGWVSGDKKTIKLNSVSTYPSAAGREEEGEWSGWRMVRAGEFWALNGCLSPLQTHLGADRSWLLIDNIWISRQKVLAYLSRDSLSAITRMPLWYDLRDWIHCTV